MSLPETITDIAEAVRSGTCSAEEVVRERLARIASQDRGPHAFISLDGDLAIERARQLDAARAAGESLGLLAGAPLAVKDNICTTTNTTTCASKMLASFRAVYNAHVVERLRAAGAVILGKTNLDEFGMGSSTESSAFGPTRNPWNGNRVAGGSSGGSAAAVAAGMVPGALGSDTGGSIRQPAAFCGIVGLKPTYGRVSRYGLVAYASSLDQIGPLAMNVRDVAALLAVIAGYDARDSTSVSAPVPDYPAVIEQSLKGVRIGVSEDDFNDRLTPSVQEAVTTAITVMEGEGAKIIPVRLPHLKYAVASYYIIAPAEASSNLARFDGVNYGYRPPYARDISDLYSSARGAGFGTEVKRRIMLGTYVLSSGYYDAYYVKALRVRTLIRRDFDRAFEQIDLIASPVAPTTAFRLGEKIEDPLAMYLTDVYTTPASLAGICAISVPCGFDPDGMPIGLQLTGPAFGEAQVLAAAHQYQLHTDHHKKRAPNLPAD